MELSRIGGNMRYAHRLTLLFAVSSLVMSCAAGSQSDSTRPRGSRTVITREELAELPPDLSVYDAVRRLRSSWLRTRGAASTRGNLQVMIYMDGVRLGGVDMIQNRALDGIIELRYFSGTEATTRWGTGVVGGVIEMITRQQPA